MIDFFRTALTRFTQAPLYSARPKGLPLGMAPDMGTPADMYRVLRAYYSNNRLYDVLGELLRQYGVWREQLKGLRNPAYRVVEWQAAHLWPGTLPGALPIETDNARIVPAIQQIWTWSNWASTKSVYARYLPLFGDAFIKVVQAADAQSVYFQVIEPETVTDFVADARDVLTYIRLDIPQSRRDESGHIERYTHTEVWDKATGRFRLWEHTQNAQASLAELGTPLRSEDLQSFGIDFVPFTHAKFSDIGEDRGVGAFTLQLDKIDEANRVATRLHQMLFRHNNVTSALERTGLDASGRPLPPVRLSTADNPSQSDGTLKLGDDVFLELPGNTTLKQLVPDIKYDAALQILNAQLKELAQDLPELIAYELADSGQRNLSGRALRILMGPAVARATEARGNAEAALIRADQMALTIAAHAGLLGNLRGDYASGAFDHSFEERDLLPVDQLEDAQTEQAEVQAKLLKIQAGVSERQIMLELGYSTEDIDRMAGEKQAGDQQLGDALLKNFDANRPNGTVAA